VDVDVWLEEELSSLEQETDKKVIRIKTEVFKKFIFI
jgi:hypothetical protein